MDEQALLLFQNFSVDYKKIYLDVLYLLAILLIQMIHFHAIQLEIHAISNVNVNYLSTH